MATKSAAKTHKFKAEVSQVLSLVINSLYSNKDIFLRELVSNASDALDKLRFAALAKARADCPRATSRRIRLIPDRAARTLTIWDNGIGMSEDALTKRPGHGRAFRHARAREKLKQSQDANKASRSATST